MHGQGFERRLGDLGSFLAQMTAEEIGVDLVFVELLRPAENIGVSGSSITRIRPSMTAPPTNSWR